MNERYLSLDGMRAFAAIGIAIMHILANIDVVPDKTIFLYGTVIPSLTNFVYMFFMISAFSMCCGYYERMKSGQISMDKFYKKRYKRILPYFALLIMIDCLAPHGANKHELSTMAAGTVDTVNPVVGQLYESFANLTLCFNLLPNADIKVIGVGWYLGIVFLFYMLFPFFVFMLDNKSRMWKSLVVTFAFCYVAINYFFTAKFIDFSVTRHNIIYSAPFFVVGGGIFLYRTTIASWVKKYKWLMLSICWLAVIGFWLTKHSGFEFVIVMSMLCGLWLCYAIGTEGCILNNKVTHYLSNISMEVYLCHMMAFRGVDMLHLSRYIQQPDLLYWLTCILTLAVAIVFSHICKYWVLPKVEPLFFKK